MDTRIFTRDTNTWVCMMRGQSKSWRIRAISATERDGNAVLCASTLATRPERPEITRSHSEDECPRPFTQCG